MVMIIPLTKDMVALVDDDVYDALSQHHWHVGWSEDSQIFVARRQIRVDGVRRCIFMHRVIMNAPRDLQVDHRDHNGLNNQRSNLRLCTKQQNGCNRRKLRQGTSKFKGVCWYPSNQKWLSQIVHDGHREHLGYFNSEIEAALAYDAAAKRYFGEFAFTNFD